MSEHEQGITPAEASGQEITPGGGSSRRKWLLAMGASLGTGAIVGNRATIGLYPKELEKLLAACKGNLQQSRDAYLRAQDAHLGTDKVLGACQGTAAEQKGKITVLETLQKKEKAVADQQIHSLQKDVLEEQIDKRACLTEKEVVEKEASQMRETSAELTKELLLARAQVDIWKGVAERNPLGLVEAWKKTVRALPAGFTDNVVEATEDINERVTENFKIIRKLIIPIKEVADKMTKGALPAVKAFDNIIGEYRRFNILVGRSIIDIVLSLSPMVEGLPPNNKSKDKMREGMNWLRGLRVVLDYEKQREVEPFENLLQMLNKAVANLDERLSASSTDPLLKAIENIIKGVTGKIETTVENWRTKTLTDLDIQIGSITQNQEQSSRLMVFMRENFSLIVDELDKKRLEINSKNIITTAQRLMER